MCGCVMVGLFFYGYEFINVGRLKSCLPLQMHVRRVLPAVGFLGELLSALGKSIVSSNTILGRCAGRWLPAKFLFGWSSCARSPRPDRHRLEGRRLALHPMRQATVTWRSSCTDAPESPRETSIQIMRQLKEVIANALQAWDVA